MTIKTILVALSLEEDCAIVASRAVQLADQHDAQLVGVHVIPSFDVFKLAPPLSVDLADLERLVRDTAADKLSSMLEKARIPAIVAVETGAPHKAIGTLAASHDVDLIVIGAGNAQGVRENVFGSTADRIVSTSSRPILVARDAAHIAYKQIVVGTDFSEASIAAAEFALRLAPSAARKLLHAVAIPPEFKQAMFSAGTARNDVELYRQAIIDRAEKQIVEVFGGEGSVPYSVVAGPPAAVLLRASQEPETDLLALGTKGLGAIAEHLLGSVVRRVLAQSDCDVLAVPPSP